MPQSDLSPTESSRAATPFRSRDRCGPALYIVTCGLVGGLVAIPFLSTKIPFGMLCPIIGCVLGGLIYRHISRDWTHDPSVPRRQFRYACIALISPPVFLALLIAEEGQRLPFAIIGLVVGGGVTCGILASGTRRHDSVNGANKGVGSL